MKSKIKAARQTGMHAMPQPCRAGVDHNGIEGSILRDEIQRSLWRVSRRSHGGEAPELKAVMDFLNVCVRDCHVWRRNVGGRDYIGSDGRKHVVFFGERGQSDLFGLVRGVHLEVEMKAPGEEPTAKQQEWLDLIRHYGGIAFYADSLEMCKTKLQLEFERRGWR